MVRRLLLMVVPLLFVLAGAMPANAQQPAPARIVAVGDLHGDYGAWIDIARDAKLIDGSNRWAGGRTVLVQTGDITDRGADSLKIIRHLRQLDGEAKRTGGRVIVLLGNHEAMQVTGDLRYVSAGEYAAFADRQSGARRDAAYDANAKAIIEFYHQRDPSLSPKAIRAMWMADHPLGKVEHATAWAPSGELGRWAATLPAVAKVGDTLFAHGGISAKYSLVPVVEINRRARAALQAGDTSPEAIINDEMGPLWYRGLITRAGEGSAPAAGRPTIESELDGALKGHGVKRIVIGHTPRLEGVAITRGGTLIRIDTGISRYYGGTLGWLEIVGDRLIAHAARRSGR
jgi:hypothetical protein